MSFKTAEKLLNAPRGRGRPSLEVSEQLALARSVYKKETGKDWHRPVNGSATTAPKKRGRQVQGPVVLKASKANQVADALVVLAKALGANLQAA